MTHLNADKENLSKNIAMKRMLCLLLSVAFLTTWSTPGFAVAEAIGPGGSPYGLGRNW